MHKDIETEFNNQLSLDKKPEANDFDEFFTSDDKKQVDNNFG